MCFAALFCSCERDEPDVYIKDYDPADFVWQKKPCTPYSYFPGIGPSTDIVTGDMLRYDSSPYLGTEPISWADIGISLATGAASGAASFLTGQLLSVVFSAFMEDDQQKIMKSLDGISNELNNLKALGYDLLNKLDEMEMNELLGKFDAINADLNLFDEFNRSYFEQIENAIRDGASEKSLKEMVLEWGGTSINGWPAWLAVKDVINDVLNFNFKYNGINLNYCMVIDMLAFDMFPWESQGYDFRDMYRGETAAKIARCLYLAAAYFTVRGLPKYVEDIESYALSLEEYFEECAVQRRDSVAVCQIQNAHFILEKDALVERKGFYFTESARIDNWFRDPSKCMNESNSVLLEGLVSKIPDGNSTSRYYSGQFTNNEIQSMINYYTPTHPYDYTLLDCLAEGGIIIPDKFKAAYTMSNEKPDIATSYDRIYFGYADTRFYLCSDGRVNRQGDPIRLGVKNFYMVGLPIAGNVGVNVGGNWTSVFSARNYNYAIDSKTHTRFPDVILDTEQWAYESAGSYYYDKWAFYNVLKFEYPGTFIMLKEGSMKRY